MPCLRHFHVVDVLDVTPCLLNLSNVIYTEKAERVSVFLGYGNAIASFSYVCCMLPNDLVETKSNQNVRDLS